MAYSLNRAQIIGNLTRDPEVRMAGEQKVATFGVATSLSWKDQSGARKEKTEFHNVVAWRKLAEICEQYLRKGSKVYVDGRLQTHDWEGEDGVKRHRTEIIIDNLIMLDKKSQSGGIGEREETGSLGYQPAEREQKSLKQDKQDQEKTPETAKPKEEEVAIDDLPF